MKVLVIGANGNTGTRVVHLLKERGHEPRALIRHVDQRPKFDAMKTETVRGDLEGEIAHAFEGCDAVVFAAGSDERTPPEKIAPLDRDGAIRAIDAAVAAGVRRFVMLSVQGAGPESEEGESARFLRAKGEADEHLRASGLVHTIVRAGRLTDRPGAVYLDVGERLGRRGQISRDDVAEVLVACLELPNTEGKTFEVLEGETPLRQALEAV